MLATRYAYPAGTEPPSLYFSTTAGPTLNSKYEDDPDGPYCEPSDFGAHPKKTTEHQKHCIISSEPTTYHEKDWYASHLSPILLLVGVAFRRRADPGSVFQDAYYGQLPLVRRERPQGRRHKDLSRALEHLKIMTI